MNLSRTFIWRKLRERKILASHKRASAICFSLLAEVDSYPCDFDFVPKKEFGTDKIIWQYWAQGYDGVPCVVKKCLESVDRFAGEYTVVRLTDDNLEDYLELPSFVKEKRAVFSRAFFSDLLRLILLSVYGGIWIDATILLSGPIPEMYSSQDFFVFRRDLSEPNKKYWRQTYAYYFGWAKGFRVNMLSSFMVAKKSNRTVFRLRDALLRWWRDKDYLPDYFFLQILFDAGAPKDICPIVSDTLPHYLQQSINDPRFNLMTKEDIITKIHIHKLTYK